MNECQRPDIIISPDGITSLAISQGISLTDSSGLLLFTISISPVHQSGLPPLPPGVPYQYSGYACIIEPSGSMFSPGISLQFSFTPAQWDGLGGKSLTIRWLDQATGEWQEISSVAYPALRTITASITRGDTYALFVGPMLATGEPTPGVATAAPAPVAFPTVLLLGIAIVIALVAAIAIYLVVFRQKGEPRLKTVISLRIRNNNLF